jgi:hypothetical protein
MAVKETPWKEAALQNNDSDDEINATVVGNFAGSNFGDGQVV